MISICFVFIEASWSNLSETVYQMASTGVMYTQNGSEDSSDDFSIIGYSEEASCVMSNSAHSNSSITLEEFNSRLIVLLRENEQLKERLKRSNAVTEEKLHFIQMWHEKTEQSKKKLKNLLAEAKDRIQSLEGENASLQTKMINHKCTSITEKSEVSAQCSDNDETSPTPRTSFVLCGTNEEITKLNKALAELDMVKTEVKVLTDQCGKQADRIDNMAKANAEQSETIFILEEEKKKLLDVQYKQNAAVAMAKTYEIQFEALKGQLDGYKSQLECSKLSSEYTVEKLKEEVNRLTSIIKLEKRANEDDRQNLETTRQHLEALQIKYTELIHSAEEQSRSTEDYKESLGLCFQTNEALQNEIKDLKAELEIFQHEYASVKRLVEENREFTTKLEAEGAVFVQTYDCPLCKKTFTDSRELQRHASNCSELQD